MGLFGSAGLKSAASSIQQIIAALVGQDIVARSIQLTSTGSASVNSAGTLRLATTGVSGIDFTDANAVQRITWGNGLFIGVSVASGNFTLNNGGLTNPGSLVMTSYTDSSGTPGNATANTATGRAAIATGASSCVISNTMVTAAARIFISPKIRDATGLLPIVSAQVAGTSFTVSVTANCTANLTFDWWVVP